MAPPRIYIPDPAKTIGQLTPLPSTEAHHVTRVLRLRAGDEIRVFDGRGREWIAELVQDSGSRSPRTVRTTPGVVLRREVTPVAEPAVRVTLGIGLLKGDQMDAVVRDATALGVRVVAPMLTAHVSVPERAWKSGAAVERWRRVAVASAKQCGRAVVPDVEQATAFSALTTRPAGVLIVCVEPHHHVAHVPAGKELPKPAASAVVLIGPEGGWSADEIAAARAAGAILVGAGPRTLRAELVPAVVLSALWTVWGW